MRDAITPAMRLAPTEKVAQAIRYLRERPTGSRYCLDQPVPRTKPAEARTVLDKWLRNRK